jgi:hypothetical protein
MPSTQVPPPKPGRPPQWPICAACGQEMNLVTVEPHVRYGNLDVRNFACSCGETASDIVARV